jgi:hypothetical protein
MITVGFCCVTLALVEGAAGALAAGAAAAAATCARGRRGDERARVGGGEGPAIGEGCTQARCKTNVTPEHQQLQAWQRPASAVKGAI